jgi:4-amino-4-deoxy-L-arabinose transferase-like glycosyltransferase
MSSSALGSAPVPDPTLPIAGARRRQSAVSAPPTPRFRFLLPAVLLLILPVLINGITHGEFFANHDEPVHAVGGLFMADLLHDWPIAAPVQYAYRWYAQYPALGLLHWPPFFYVVEGLFFSVLGPTAVAARLAVIAFALVGLSYWFWLVADLQDELTAAAATILLAFSPAVLLFEKSAMLEVPALSLCIAATYYWLRALRSDGPPGGDLYRFAVLAALALLTKQHSIYLALFCLLTLVAERKLSLLGTRSMVAALVIVLLVAGPFYAAALALHPQTIAADVLQGTGEAEPWSYYLRALPRLLGWPLLLLSMAGMVTSPWWIGFRRIQPLLLWIVACYVTFSFLGQKDPRYILYWVPAFVFLAAGVLSSRAVPRQLRWVTIPALLVLIAYQTWWAWHYERPYVSGYEQAARLLMQSGAPGLVVFDGDLHGNVAFYVRANDPRRQAVILRKALYVTRVLEQYGSKELVQSRADVERMLSDYGVRYVLVDNSEPRFESQKLLREVLAAPPFYLVATIPIETNVASWKGRQLSLYENPNPPPMKATSLRLGMLTLPQDIEIPMEELPLR